MPIDPSAQRKVQSLSQEIVKLHQDHKDQVSSAADQVKKQTDMLKAKKDQIIAAQQNRHSATNKSANANTSTAGQAHHDTGLSTGGVKEQIDLTQLVAEATGQGGFDYEKKVNDTLKKHGLADKHSKTAGSSADAPDAKFKHNKKEHNLEIKADHKAMFGQIELKHDGKKWDISDRSKEKYPHTAKSITDSGFLKKVNKHWGKPSGDYEKDLQMGNVYHTHHDAEPIKAHYGKDRKTDYIQIGGHGFYHTGKDEAGLGSPELNGKATLRARMKARSKDKNGKRKYGALVVMGLKDADKSHHDLDAKPQKEWIEDVLKGHTILESALNPKDPHKDYEAKRKALHDLSLNKDVDQAHVQQRRLDLDKEYTKYKKESVEINELSTDTLASYKTKAAASAKAADQAGDYAKGDKRFKGINKATIKQFDNDLKKHGQYTKEEVQTEAHKIGDKVIIHKGPKDVVGKTGHVGEIRKRWAGDTKTYTIDHDGGSIQLKSSHFKALKEDMDQLRSMLNKHSELAIAANRKGDDEKVKHHQNMMNKVKDKMAKMVKENSTDWGSILNEDAKCFVDAFWSGQQEEPKKNPYAEGTTEYYQYENGYMQGVMKRRVMQTESRAHKTLATFFKNRETANSFATGKSDYAPVAPVPDKKYIKGTPEYQAHKATKKPINGHPTNKIKESYEEAEDHLSKANDAEREGRMKDFHAHMADHHDALSMWHDSKGRSASADKHAEKADYHHQKSLTIKEEGEGGVPANNAGDGKIAGFQGDAGKKVLMTKKPLQRKAITDFKKFVSQEHEEV